MAKLPVEKLKASKTKPVPVKIVSDAPSPSAYSESDRKWKAEDALRDIERAQKHMRDKSLMADVKKLAKDKVAALKKIC